MAEAYDIVIVGGGLIGSSLALALAPTNLSIAIVEASAINTNEQPSFDERTIALTYRSKQIFQALNVWQPEVIQAANPIERIHISERGQLGISHLNCEDVGTDALGHVVPTRVLGKVLYQRLDQCNNITLYCPAQATELSHEQDSYQISVTTNTDQTTLSARLLVIADGGRSPLIDQLGVTSTSTAYSQSALLSIVEVDQAHNNLAYERFTPSGPLALLPMTDQRYAVVWTLNPDELEHISTLDDDAYLKALQAEFGYRAGNFSKPSTRKSYPLSKQVIDQAVLSQAVIIGNAAHLVHPVAGQGFNLGLRDVAVLAELISDAIESKQDFASNEHLQSYAQLRA